MAGPDEVSCIVRSVGERTTALCVRLLREFFSREIPVVRREPFQAALAESLRLGLGLGRPWTLIIDADVLCGPRGLAAMLDLAGELPEDSFMFLASVTDRFFRRYRRAGNRLYRTRHLAAALSRIPADGASLRPERDMCEAMRARGLRNFQTMRIVGLHDYEQAYADILRKSALFALKHGAWREALEALWEAEPENRDFRCALDGLRAAPGTGPASISPALLGRLPHALVRQWRREEKPPLADDALSAARVEELCLSELARAGIRPTPHIAPRECRPCAG